ncbi:hypothetical protein MIR68_011541 [Amoeboaphelidium protococcarum]|nr:hypothetical protein MIR68_011541 [Amoeboaphelidium protococcarum]
MATERSAAQDVVSRIYTVNLHKLTYGKQFKKRAPTAIKKIKQFATKVMGTTDVRIDTSLNQAVWSNGIKNLPNRLRVQMSRKRSEEENPKEKLYVVCSFVPVTSFKGLQTQVLEE